MHPIRGSRRDSKEEIQLKNSKIGRMTALALLTHSRAVPYDAYVERLKPNPIARAVKLADLRHNSDLTRLNHVDARALERAEKYRRSIEQLEKVP